MIPHLFRRHAHWTEFANAYIDGELAPAELVRFEEHLRQCDDCRETVDAARASKALLAAMPVVRAPRSFALTPALLAAPARPQRPHGRPIALRLAQGATAVAVVALGAVVAIDVTSGGSNSSQPLAASQESVTSRVNAATVESPAAGASPTVTPAREAQSATPPTSIPIAPPPNTGGVGAQGYSPSPSPTASPTAVPPVGGAASPEPQVKDAAGSAVANGSFSAHDNRQEAKHAASSEEPRKASVTGWYRPAEIALAIGAAVAGAAALVLALRRRA